MAVLSAIGRSTRSEPQRHIRLSVLKDLAANNIEDCRVIAIAKRLRKPWSTIRRTLEALYVLDLVHCIESDDEGQKRRH
jgi:DNA-binding transcriptional ArsR family regulator